jgi:dTDP-4-amino-4,6-dideoxygalactose transaminase
MTQQAARLTTLSLLARPNLPFSPWPHFEAEEIDAVSSVLRSGKVNYWTGEQGRHFEREFAHSVGVLHAICVANGTAALELALFALGIGRGDEVIAPARTFFASASCIAMRGARPVFADVDRESQNITAETIRRVITPRTRAIIVVHLAGWPCEMDAILALAKERDLRVIEDCAQAQGATYKGRSVGSMGDAAAFSFCQDKIMTTGGEGGMLVTNNTDIWSSAWSFRDHGKSYAAVNAQDHPPGFRWLHESFGTNWRMTEMQAALGRVVLKKVPTWIERRRRHAATLTSRFSGVPGLRLGVPSDEYRHAYYKYYAFIRPEMLRPGWSRDRIIEEVDKAGVPCFVGSCSELYLEKAFAKRPTHARRPVAKLLGETSLMFLVHPTLTDQHMEATCEAVQQVMWKATKRNPLKSL